MHSYSCVVCRSSSGNQRTCLLDMGGVMTDYDIETIQITITYEDGTKKILNSGCLSDEILDALYQEIDQYLEDK